MAYERIFARSFSQYEQQKMGIGAFVACLFIAYSICAVFKPCLYSLQFMNLRLPMSGAALRMMMIKDASHHQPKETTTFKIDPMCNFTVPRYNFCEAKGDIRIHGANTSTVYVTTTLNISDKNNSWEIRPYARKTDAFAMRMVRKWLVTRNNQTGYSSIPSCTITHNVPAILFSVGAYAGNHFHDFTDIVIPLFLTSKPFNGEVKFVITDNKGWWPNKFRVVLKRLSNYDIIDIDHDTRIHCFPIIVVGLKSHKELNMDSSRPPYYSMDDFRAFLRNAYSLNRTTAIDLDNIGINSKTKPRLIFISRKRTRSFTNEKVIADMARKSGFEVVAAEADARSNLLEFAQLINSCDVIMGVHGAGLTNMVFLPDNAVLIQVIPLGKLEWLSRKDFGDPSKDMRLRYLEYEIKASESSLINDYPLDHVVFKDPFSIHKKGGWAASRSVYMDKQNVTLDVKRFRPVLVKAMELLHQNLLR